MAGFLTGGGGLGGYAADFALGPIGMMAGGLGGSGLFGGPNFGREQDVINQRQAEIAAFEAKLNTARGNVLSNYQNLQATTMARFMPMAEANLAGRGLGVGSGAFASALAKEAVGLQGNYDTLNTNLTEKNLYDVENMRSQLFGAQMGLANEQTMIPFEQKQQLLGGLLGMGGRFAGMAMGGALAGPVGAAMGGAAGGNVFGGTNVPSFGGYGGFQGTSSSMVNPGAYDPSQLMAMRNGLSLSR